MNLDLNWTGFRRLWDTTVEHKIWSFIASEKKALNDVNKEN